MDMYKHCRRKGVGEGERGEEEMQGEQKIRCAEREYEARGGGVIVIIPLYIRKYYNIIRNLLIKLSQEKVYFEIFLSQVL